MFKLEQPGEIEKLAIALEQLGSNCVSTEEVALSALNYLYSQLSLESEKHPCVLMRFFRTMSYTELTPALQDRVKQMLKGEPRGRTNCLTLLASRGDLPEWNHRFESHGHQVIPLVSAQMIAEAPMIAQLVKRLGIDVPRVVNPSPSLFLNPKEKRYNVMYVPHALNSEVIVAQGEFVVPYNIHSVVGFGSLLPTGDMLAVIMFMREFVSEHTAHRFTLLASALETAVNKIRSGKKSNARILVAAEHADRLTKLLAREHEIVYATTVASAIAATRSEIFDLTICGTEFDDSRMFELLSAMKHNKEEKPKPFICFGPVPSPGSEATAESISLAAKVVGAACFLEAFRMNDVELKAAIESYLPEEIWTAVGKI